MIIKNNFHKKGFVFGLVLKQRLAASRKWPIELCCFVRVRVVKEIKNAPSALLSYYKHAGFF